MALIIPAAIACWAICLAAATIATLTNRHNT